MTLNDIKNAIKRVGIPTTYYEWEHSTPQLPYIVYQQSDTDNVFADDKNYIEVSKIQVELYTKKRDRDTEKLLENALSSLGVTWQREGATKVEHALMTVYTFDTLINEEE